MKVTNVHAHTSIVSATPPSVPRLRLEPTGSRRTMLDGAWWPRSTDPIAELPGLVLAIDKIRGPVTRLVLAAGGWDNHPRRLSVQGRVLRLGYFTSQPLSLLTAICDRNERVDLLVVAPGTASGTADTAMILAATTTNRVQARHIVHAVSTPAARAAVDNAPEDAWETDGGRRAPAEHKVPEPAGRER
ncbi:hypothetical protein GCM10010112_44830 [Actinoplanes lobatus]|uniref:Uncharacterized protein n=1 Tax=Actinoplanes lobatus TaxID=113568 RepID=A0A7W7HG76_9ACTN|nr:DUF5994 family protein [Actinoplanes lobatus]MBB4749968.1 hypothetical protein [Actinoplanes lobatus]GGN74572.1 hypothetical protein GCM10010112_44830 [Actinoplanes lobatus]GIE39143.1 hypothetical protein Alo02nite_20410 [Actinoplanes lobatus]